MKKNIPFILNMFAGHQRGSALISAISLILFMAVIGSVLLELTTSSTFGELSYNHMERAYFMAEAGIRYANKLVKEGKDAEIEGQCQTFTLDEDRGFQNGQFEIRVDNDSDASYTLIHSIGTINTRISSKVEVELCYKRPKPVTSSPFDKALFAYTKLELKENVTIERDDDNNGGIGTNASNIHKESGVTITGGEKTNMERTLTNLTFPPEWECKNDKEINGIKTWDAGERDYKKVIIKAGSKLKINGDVTLYVKEDFIVEKESKIVIKAASSLTIYVDKKVEFKERSRVIFNSGPDRAEDFVIWATEHADTLKLERYVSFIGAIYAPNADTQIQEVAILKGAIVVDKLVVEKKVAITYDPDTLKIFMPGSTEETRNPIQYFSPSSN